MNITNNSLAHTTWNCKYHVVFAPKYRRQIIYGKLKAEIGKILRTLCERKGIDKSFAADISFEPCTWNLKPGAKK